MLSCSIWFSAPSLWMGGGLEIRCVGLVCSVDGAVRHPHRIYIILYYIILYYIILYYIISYRIVSYHIIYYIISYRIISYHTIYYIISYIILYYIIFSQCKTCSAEFANTKILHSAASETLTTR